MVVRSLQGHSDANTPIVVEFNPWAFSTQAELFESFFSEVSRSLGRKNAGEVGAALSRLGSYLGIGARAAKAVQAAADIAMVPGGALIGMVADSLERGSEQATAQAESIKAGMTDNLDEVQAELGRAIEKLGRSILIVIDDLDRLPPEQVMQIFQVVRVNAALPRINFLLLVDRGSLLRSLDLARQAPDYLDKIVQFALNLPRVPADDLREVAKAGLEAIASELKLTVDWSRWHDDYVATCQSILDTPRKIKRLLHTFRFHLTVFCQDGVPEVDLVDLFLLEVIRLYAPEVWLRLPKLGRQIFGYELIRWYVQHGQHATPPFEDQFADTVKLAPSEIQAACSLLLKRLLPQFDKGYQVDDILALSTCRMCTATHFDSYFLLTTNRAYPTQKDGLELLALLPAPAAFTSKGRELMDRYGFANLLTKLQVIQRSCRDLNAIATMIGAVWRLDEEDAAIDPVERNWGARDATEEFTRFFLLRVPDEKTRVEIVTSALHSTRSPHQLIDLTRRDIRRFKEPWIGITNVFSEAKAMELQQLSLKRILEMRDADELYSHPELGTMLWLWKDVDGDKGGRSWLKQQCADGVRLGTILTAFFGRSTSASAVRYFLERKVLEEWFILDGAFRASLESVDRSKLGRWQSHAVSEALRILDGAVGGDQEADLPN